MKRTNEYIRNREGKLFPVKAYRVGELMLHRQIDEAQEFDGVIYKPHGWTVSHRRTGVSVARVAAKVSHKEALRIAKDMDAAADRLWPRLRWNEHTNNPGPNATIKAIGEVILPIRDQLRTVGKVA